MIVQSSLAYSVLAFLNLDIELSLVNWHVGFTVDVVNVNGKNKTTVK
jgi:hypothetical protein